MKSIPALLRAIKIFGSHEKLAKKVNKSRPAVKYWIDSHKKHLAGGGREDERDLVPMPYSIIIQLESNHKVLAKDLSKKSFKYTTKLQFMKCIYIIGDQIRFIKGELSSDMLWFTPTDIKRRIRVKKIYMGSEEPYIICCDKFPASIDISKKLQLFKVQKPSIKLKLENKNGEPKIIESIDMKEYEVKGGDVLSSVGYDVARTSLLRYMESPTRMEFLFTLVIGILLGVLVGISYK